MERSVDGGSDRAWGDMDEDGLRARKRASIELDEGNV